MSVDFTRKGLLKNYSKADLLKTQDPYSHVCQNFITHFLLKIYRSESHLLCGYVVKYQNTLKVLRQEFVSESYSSKLDFVQMNFEVNHHGYRLEESDVLHSTLFEPSGPISVTVWKVSAGSWRYGEYKHTLFLMVCTDCFSIGYFEISITCE